jgi:hypothetical protein
LTEQILSYKTLFFDTVTTIGYALLPAMNKSLHAALVKICTSGDGVQGCNCYGLGVIPFTTFGSASGLRHSRIQSTVTKSGHTADNVAPISSTFLSHAFSCDIQTGHAYDTH